MKYIDGFRNARAASAIGARIATLGGALSGVANIMEVCGSHTMAIARYGIRGFLPANVRLVSGPGCPVCVTAPGYIDAAIELARRGVIVASFGDMVQVPGSDESLAQARSEGARVEVCYSPVNALDLARRHPDREVVFLAIGFETTIAPALGLLDKVIRAEVSNLSLLTAFKLVPPALAALMADEEVRIDAFLCPAHVSAIIGSNAYVPFAGEGGVPCVVAGFEPLDILYGLQGILEQLVQGDATVENQYSRVVRPEGNCKAQALFDKYLEPVDAAWRGIGVLPASGLGLRAAFRDYDAAVRHGVATEGGRQHAGCICGDVLKGKNQPNDCRLFGSTCTPEHPVGPCMVSSEGSCSAQYKYA